MTTTKGTMVIIRHTDGLRFTVDANTGLKKVRSGKYSVGCKVQLLTTKVCA